MKTYRYRGHSRSDPAKYRPDGELERWKERDPITLLGLKLTAAGLLNTQTEAALADEVQADIDAAADRALGAPYPTLEETARYVYAD
jgi:pyruvate dehydrogenase E1 component alpha subunit